MTLINFHESSFKQKKIGLMIIFIYCFGFRNGNVRATSIELAEPRYQGVVCSMKESFGFIERADVVKEVRL